MKKLLYTLGIAIIVLSTAGCDVIDTPDRLKDVEKVPANKNILLFDFTDQTCVNCPDAAAKIEELKAVYGDTLIAVSIHAYAFQLPIHTLLTDKGSEYELKFNKQRAHPMGSIDGKASMQFSDWKTGIRPRLAVKSPVGVELSCDYNSATGEVAVTSVVTGYENTSDLKFLLWIVESDIVAKQITKQGVDENYVHNHVFRDAINDTWGEDFAVEKNKTWEKEYRYSLNKEWKPENISIIGFVYSNSMMNNVENESPVYQTAEVHLIGNETEIN
ncbi:MAG: Omp28 family outer membrane lipoprotein [Cytophagaceae bacterium]|jgi:hypothetical protein|nr:Omp28 family outer membrane lipoprotein [Cytophagaceae bacterium]